ncbi:MAG: hypothetical protein ABT00_09660 [Bordetella sp. SCN 68-11]|nr:MAG: hypothetical protein ABT00_09660 [Bordetella sp. SCN 68-11]
MNKPLHGVRVVEMGSVVLAPYAAQILADLGADVIKVEPPKGDITRNQGFSRHAGMAALYLSCNRGKRSLVLDAKQPEGLAALRRLLSGTDVFLHNLRAATAERLGIGHASVSASNPGLIYCATYGYGAAGRHSDRPAYDHVVQAMTGMAMMGGVEGDDPIKTGFPVVDAATGMLGALAIVSALHQRNRDGRSILLDVSMAAASMQLMYSYAVEALTKGVSPRRVGNQGYSGSPAADFFRTRDGWIALGANTPAQFARLLEVLELGELAADPALFDGAAEPGEQVSFLRAKDPVLLKSRLRERIAGWEAARLEQRLAQAGVPASKVRSVAEFAADAVASGALEPVVLKDGEDSATVPGLGFRAWA